MSQVPPNSETEKVLGEQRKTNSMHLRWNLTLEDLQLNELQFSYFWSFQFHFTENLFHSI